MAKLVSMAMSETERKKDAPTVMADKGPRYPYGLELHLSDEVLSKLDLDGLPKVGSAVTIQAKAKITSASENDHGDGKRRSLSVQITALAVDDGKDATEKKLYGD